MNDMKKIYALFALPALMLTACSDDINPDVPETVPGEDIVFKASLPQGTRTVYGDFNADGTARKVMWVNGDKVNVFSPQCEANFRQAEYEVKVANNQSYADELVKTGTTGLRWGTASAEETKFYAAYPENATLAQESDGTVTASFHIDDVQTTLMQSATTNGKTVWSPSATAPTPNNIMFAQPLANGQSQVTAVDGKTVANLQFTPYSTVLHMTFAGWALTNPDPQGADNMTVYSVRLNSTGTSDIAGNFPLTLKADGTAPTVGNNVTLGNKSITVNVDAGAEINGISLKPGDSFECDLFMIPTGATISDQWSVDLITSAGTFSRKLEPAAGANSTLKPGQIHKMNFPAITVDNGWEYHPDSWLADIPDNVYFTEVSLPGSWYSASTSGDKYQDDDIATQFSKGIRAFFLETRVGTSGGNYTLNSLTNQGRLDDQLQKRNSNDFTVVISGTGKNQSIYGDLNAYYSATTIDATLTAIAEQVSKHQTEFAVLTLSYSDGGSAGVSGFWKSVWLQKILNAINANELFKQYLYTETVNASTTVSALRGKILLKINVDDDTEITSATTSHSLIGLGNAATNTTYVDQTLFSKIPALFSFTNQNWTTNTEQNSLVSNLYWKGNPTLTDATIGSTGFFWNYTMANRTYGTGLPTLGDRQSSISNLIANSKNARAQGEHNVFFMIGAGGSYFNSTSSDTGSPSSVADNLNPFLLGEINKKIEAGEASPLGLVYTNFTTGTTGQQVVDAIIRMNHRFKLLEIGGTQGGGTGTQINIKSVIPTHSSGYKKAAGNGWNAF